MSPKEASKSVAGSGGNGAAEPFKLMAQTYGCTVKDQSSLDELSISLAQAVGILSATIQSMLNILAI